MVELFDLLIIIGVVISILLLLWIALRLSGGPTAYDTASLEAALRASLAQSSEVLKGAFATSVKELGLDKDLGAIKTTAQQILSSSKSLQTLFEVKRGRAQFAEFQLEELLKDIFPPGKVGIRQKLPGFGTPDAHLETSEGILCIDAKFPLDNYRRMLETEDEAERRRRAKEFARDVQRHVDKIAGDYVKPEEGGAPFALGFIPAEAVYQYLTEAEGDLMRDAAARGVNLVSPSTLVTSINILALAVRAQEIAERAEDIEESLQRMERRFQGFDGHWETMKTHLSNAYRRMVDADKSYGRLRQSYRRIARLEEPEEDD
ncbi:MAG: DNA recombination protein RmuC [Thermoplasmata archaeon]